MLPHHQSFLNGKIPGLGVEASQAPCRFFLRGVGVVGSLVLRGVVCVRQLGGMADVLGLCRDMERVEFQTGDFILRQGTAGNGLYILLSGKVEVRNGETVVAALDRPGLLLGEISVLLGCPPIADVVAVGPVVCHTTPDGRAFLAAHPELSLFVAELLALRLRGMMQYLTDLKRQYEDREDHLGMVDRVLETLAHRQPGKKSSVPS